MPSSAAYLNFDLLITRAGERYRALVVDAPGGDADIFFDLPPSLPGFQDLLALTGPRRGVRDEPTRTVPTPSLDEVGRLLYECIFQGEVRDVLVASQREAAENAAGLRLRLRFNEDAAELATLPWEILYDAGQERFLALSESLPILRYLSLPRPRPALVTEPPLRILAVLANPDGLDPLDLEGEWQVLAEALAPLVDDGKVVLERLAAPTPSALQGRLLGDPVHVLHFVGHGVFDEDTRQGMLVLADERNQPKLMGARELATLLANHLSLRLLYLNACEGALGDDANVFAGLAQRLVQGGAPAAIAMQAEISDRASIDLARTFYTALATGRPVDAALTQARVTLAMNSSREWATPVLFSRAPDNRLFDIRAVLPTPDCPYPGMKPFTEDQKAFFFGRDKEIDDAVNRLAKYPFLAVVGPSGSGKSSLVYAGILPALRASRRFGPDSWTVHTLRPSDARTTDGKAAPMKALSQLGDLSTQSPVPSPQSPVLLFIDQFEETFTLADAAEARAFLDAVHGLIGQPNLRILLTVRADFYAEMMAMGDLWEDVQSCRLELTPLGEDELWAAIVEPAARVGVEVEDALATALIADAHGEAGVLPLVQETLVLLWDKVEGRQLKRNAYRYMGDENRSGIQVAIDHHASALYNQLSAEGKPVARRTFLRLIQFGAGRADTRRQQTVAELRASGDDLVLFDETLRTLVDNRLLTTSGEEESSDRRIDISHEALISSWHLLQRWIEEKRESESVRRRLEESAVRYMALERRGGLLDQREMAEVMHWISSPDSGELGISHQLTSLIDDSRRALRRAAIIRYGSLAAIIGLIVVALVVFAVFQNQLIEEQNDNATAQAVAASEIAQKATEVATALVASNAAAATAEWNAYMAATSEARAAEQALVAEEQKNEAERNAREATANKYAAQAQALLIRNDTTSAMSQALNGVLSTFEIDHNVVVDADAALRSAIGVYSFRSTLPYFRHVAGINTIALSPDGNQVATASDDQGVRLWNLDTQRHLHFFGNLAGSAETVAFNPEGTVLVAGGQDPSIQVWDLARMTLLRSLAGHQGGVRYLSFSPDGAHMLSAGEDGSVIVWSARDWTRQSTLSGQGGAVYAATFTPDGKHIVSASQDGRLRLWDIASSQPLQTIPASGAPLHTLAISPDGAWVAAGGDEPVIHLWNLNTGEPIGALSGHERSIFSLTLNQQGTLLASASADSTIKLWNVATQTLVRTLQGGERNRKPFTSLAFSEDGRWLISGGDDRTVRIWNSDTGDEISSFPGHVDAVTATTFTPDSTEIATVGQDQQIRFWSVSSGMTTAMIQTRNGGLNTLDYSNDGRYVAAAGEDGNIRIWSRLNGSTILTLTGHTDAVTAVAYRFDDERIVSGGLDGTLRVWNGTDGTQEIEIEAGTSSVRTVAFEPAGNLFASAGDDGVIRLWDSEDGQMLAELEGHEGPVYSLTFSSASNLLASAGADKSVRVWNVRNRVPLRLFQGHTDQVRAVAFSPDGKRVASGGDDRTVRLWNVERGEAIRILFGHADIVRSLAFSPDGDTLVSTAGGVTGNNSVRIWAVKPLFERFKLEPHGNLVRWATFSPDGRWIATACDDGMIRIWDGESSDLVTTINAHGIRVRTVAFSHDSTRLVSAGDDNMIRIWEVGTWQKLADLSGHQAWVRSAFFSPDDRTIVSASEDRSVRLWDARSGAEIRQLTGHEGVVVFAQFSPDGKQIASAGFDRTVRLWSAEDGEWIRTLSSASHFNNIVAFSPDGSTLAVGTGDADNVNLVQFWDVSSGEEVTDPQLHNEPLRLIHNGPVRGVAFSADGKWLLTAGHGNPVQLWDWQQNRPLRTFTEHNRSVWSVNFSTDAEYFITGSEDSTARLWITSIEAQMDLARALLARDPPIFTPETRTHLISYGE